MPLLLQCADYLFQFANTQFPEPVLPISNYIYYKTINEFSLMCLFAGNQDDIWIDPIKS